MNIPKIKSVEKISLNLKNLLKHHNISIRGLSRAIGTTPAHITKLSKCEYASPGLDILEKISIFFNISIAQLFGEQEIDFENKPKDLDLNFNEKQPLTNNYHL